jgi:HEPN domain-containing protein
LQDEKTLSFPLPTAIFGFHAQQATEKLLKALICEHNSKYARTHVIEALILHLQALREPLPELPWDIAALTDYAVEFRYDDPADFVEEDRELIRESIRVLRSHILARIEKMRTR